MALMKRTTLVPELSVAIVGCGSYHGKRLVVPFLFEDTQPLRELPLVYRDLQVAAATSSEVHTEGIDLLTNVDERFSRARTRFS